MSNKLTKIGKSTLSLILCLTMLLTTFCFFDIGSVISEAMISKDEHDLSAAGASSNAFSKYSINFPELVYKKAGKTYSEYFLNNDASGNVEGAKSEMGNFSCDTAGCSHQEHQYGRRKGTDGSEEYKRNKYAQYHRRIIFNAYNEY